MVTCCVQEVSVDKLYVIILVFLGEITCGNYLNPYIFEEYQHGISSISKFMYVYIYYLYF